MRYLQVTTNGDITTLHLPQKVLEEANALELELLDFVIEQKPMKLLISFDQVARCTSELIGPLIRARTRVRRYGGQIKLCSMSRGHREVFQICGLDGTVFQIYDSCREAAESFD